MISFFSPTTDATACFTARGCGGEHFVDLLLDPAHGFAARVQFAKQTLISGSQQRRAASNGRLVYLQARRRRSALSTS